MSLIRLLVITGASWLVGWAVAHAIHRLKHWHMRKHDERAD